MRKLNSMKKLEKLCLCQKVHRQFKAFAVSVIFFASFSDNLWADQVSQTEMATFISQEVASGKSLDIMLPINLPLQLISKLPREFQLAWQGPMGTSYEFIPKSEKLENWSQIITFVPLVGKKINASLFNKFVINHIQTQAKPDSLKFLEQSQGSGQINGKNYSWDFQIARYFNPQSNKTEVVSLYSASGPNDCLNIQYTIRPRSESDTAHQNMELKIFFKQHFNLISDGSLFPIELSSNQVTVTHDELKKTRSELKKAADQVGTHAKER